MRCGVRHGRGAGVGPGGDGVSTVLLSSGFASALVGGWLQVEIKQSLWINRGHSPPVLDPAPLPLVDCDICL